MRPEGIAFCACRPKVSNIGCFFTTQTFRTSNLQTMSGSEGDGPNNDYFDQGVYDAALLRLQAMHKRNPSLFVLDGPEGCVRVNPDVVANDPRFVDDGGRGYIKFRISERPPKWVQVHRLMALSFSQCAGWARTFGGAKLDGSHLCGHPCCCFHVVIEPHHVNCTRKCCHYGARDQFCPHGLPSSGAGPCIRNRPLAALDGQKAELLGLLAALERLSVDQKKEVIEKVGR